MKFPNIILVTKSDYPCSKMSFRSDPLPSYEDIISGNFVSLKKQTKTETVAISTETENIKQQQSVEVGQFKYKTFNKIIEKEDGEVSEDGNFKETKRPAKNAKQSHKPQNNLIIKQKTQKPEIKKRSRTDKNTTNFTSNTTSSSSSSSNGKNAFVPRLICRYFMEGVCSKGDKCTFSHAVVPNKTPEEAKVKEPCKFFIAGSCMKGESCYYSHDLSVVPCKFFHLKGECSANAKGAACRFSHEPIDKETLEKLRQNEAERIKEKLAAEASIESSNLTASSTTTTKPEQSQTSKEAEAATECPHDVDLLNPFAGDDNYDDDY